MPKRILHITGGLNVGGTETFIMNVFRTIDRRYMFDFLLSTTNREGGFYDEAAKLGARIYSVPSRRQGYFKQSRALDAFFKEHAGEYAAVHLSACSLTEVKAMRYARKYGIPVRIIHGHSSSWHGLHNLVFHSLNKLRIGRFANRLIACGEAARRFFYGNREAIIMNNGINVTRFKYAPEVRCEMRRRLCFDKEIVLGHVGRLDAVKNQSFILDIVAALTNVKALFVGDGSTRHELEQKAVRLGINDRVIFAGVQKDVAPYYQAMDVMVFPSLYEGLPFTLIEAQTSGLPVIASTNVPSECAITENVSFLPLDQGMPPWIEKISTINPTHREDCSQIISAAGFSIVDTTAKLCEIYDGK